MEHLHTAEKWIYIYIRDAITAAADLSCCREKEAEEAQCISMRVCVWFCALTKNPKAADEQRRKGTPCMPAMHERTHTCTLT